MRWGAGRMRNCECGMEDGDTDAGCAGPADDELLPGATPPLPAHFATKPPKGCLGNQRVAQTEFRWFNARKSASEILSPSQFQRPPWSTLRLVSAPAADHRHPVRADLRSATSNASGFRRLSCASAFALGFSRTSPPSRGRNSQGYGGREGLTKLQVVQTMLAGTDHDG